LHELRRLRIGIEADREERKLAGKTLDQIVRRYETADDERDEVLVYLIETQTQAGWPDVTLAKSDSDVPAMMRLSDLIKARQRARLEKNHPDVIAAADRLEKLRSSSTVDMAFRHLLKDGRGVALAR